MLESGFTSGFYLRSISAKQGIIKNMEEKPNYG
jgi:hypothetical protein